MSRRRHMLSFTERRRASLAKKVAQLDQLETRNTITEPISVVALSVSAFTGLARLGIMSPNAMSNELNGPAGLGEAANRQGRAAPATRAPSNFLPLAIGLPAEHPSGAAGGGGPDQGAAIEQPAASQPAQSIDGLSSISAADSSASEPHGLSAPWHPVGRAGGGAALPPRGGSGNGAQAATIALVQGHASAVRTPPPPTSSPASAFTGTSDLGGEQPRRRLRLAARDPQQGGGRPGFRGRRLIGLGVGRGGARRRLIELRVARGRPCFRPRLSANPHHTRKPLVVALHPPRALRPPRRVGYAECTRIPSIYT